MFLLLPSEVSQKCSSLLVCKVLLLLSLFSSAHLPSTAQKINRCPLLRLARWCIHGIQTLRLASTDTLDSFNPCSQTNPSGLCNSFSPSSLPSGIIPVYGPFPRLLPVEGGEAVEGQTSQAAKTWKRDWSPASLASLLGRCSTHPQHRPANPLPGYPGDAWGPSPLLRKYWGGGNDKMFVYGMLLARR